MKFLLFMFDEVFNLLMITMLIILMILIIRIRTIAPRLGLGFVLSLGLVLGFGTTRQLPLRKIAPSVRVRVRVSFVVGGQFSSGAIVLT